MCTTLGMLTPEQAKQLREAGLTAYNHNLDTSPEYYSKITSSRRYEAIAPAQDLKAKDTTAAPCMLLHDPTPIESSRQICLMQEVRGTPWP